MDKVPSSHRRVPLHCVGLLCILVAFSLSKATAEESLIQVRLPESWRPDNERPISSKMSEKALLIHGTSYSETLPNNLPNHRMHSWTIKEKVKAKPDKLIQQLKDFFIKHHQWSQSSCRVELGYQTDKLAKCVRHQWGIEVYTNRTTRLGSYDFCMYSKDGHDRQVLVFFCSNNEERKRMDSIINKVRIR